MVDVAAYNYFLRGRGQMYLHTRAGNANVRAFMAKAIELEPNHAAAYAVIAFSHVNDYANGWAAEPETALSTGLDLARRAVAMDDQEPDAYFALGMALMWSRQLDEALDAVARCIALKPSATDARVLKAHAQIFIGLPADAIETLDDYMQLDPMFPEIALQFLAEARFALGEYDLALEAIRNRLERNPESATAHALLASTYGHLGRSEEGRAAWEQVFRIDPGFSVERRRRVLPFRNPADFERRVDGLRKLGLAV